MAAFANRYLRYRDEPHGKREPLLWPVYVYRIMYPADQKNELDLFQRAVLGLARAGCQDTHEISLLLNLHVEMVLLIVARCLGAGWIDAGMRLTDAGISLLEKDEDKNLELKCGLLFQDAISGVLWPRFDSDMPEIEAVPESGDFPIFRSSRTSGLPLRPYLLKPKLYMPPLLESQEILEAYRLYRLDHFNAKQLYGAEELPEQVRTSGIELMSEQPEPMYVLTWVAENLSGDKPWKLCDPFKIRQQVSWLEDVFTELLPHDGMLVRKLSRVAGKPEPEKQSVDEWMRSMEQALDMDMLIEHAWGSRQELVARYYTSLKRRLLLIEQGMGKHELAPALADAQKLCEAVCQWIVREFTPDLGVFPKLKNHDRDLNKSILQALDLPALTPRAIGFLAGQNLKQVLSVLEGRNQSLKAMLFGALLSTLGVANHPLRKVAAEKLELEQLFALADARNDATHASGKEFKQDDVIQLGEFALNWTLLFKDWM